MSEIRIPGAPRSIQKGVPLTIALDVEAVGQLGDNLHIANNQLDKEGFVKEALKGLGPLSIKERADHIAHAMKKFLPQIYEESIKVVLNSLTPPLEKTEDNGLAPMFYMPHNSYVANFGVNPKFNQGKYPFDVSMKAQYELTKRFTCEFSIRTFITEDQNRTLKYLFQ